MSSISVNREDGMHLQVISLISGLGLARYPNRDDFSLHHFITLFQAPSSSHSLNGVSAEALYLLLN